MSFPDHEERACACMRRWVILGDRPHEKKGVGDLELDPGPGRRAWIYL